MSVHGWRPLVVAYCCYFYYLCSMAVCLSLIIIKSPFPFDLKRDASLGDLRNHFDRVLMPLCGLLITIYKKFSCITSSDDRLCSHLSLTQEHFLKLAFNCSIMCTWRMNNDAVEANKSVMWKREVIMRCKLMWQAVHIWERMWWWCNLKWQMKL